MRRSGLVDLGRQSPRPREARRRLPWRSGCGLGLGLGNALDAVHAGLELHDGVDAVALDLELDGLKAAGLAGAGVEHGGLPAARLAEALIHLVQVAGEDGRLVATGGGANLDDGVLVVVGGRSG